MQSRDRKHTDTSPLSRFHSLAKRLVAIPKAEVGKQKALAVKKPRRVRAKKQAA